jgi:hypothetical protein
MKQNRMNRELESREAETREESWAPPSQLPTPAPQDGYKFRWVRTSVLGLDDSRNVSIRRREGWEPVKAEDHPELLLDLGLSNNSTSKTGLVEFGGLMLCKTTEAKAIGRQRYYERMSEQQLQSVDNNYLKESDSRMPMFSEKRSDVTFGRGI